VLTNPNNIAGTTYTWTRDNTTNLTGIAASGSGTPISGTLTNINPLQEITTFTITANANGCTTTTTAIVRVNTKPNVTVDPGEVIICQNNTAAIFTASATGSPTPTAQWQVSTDNGSSWSNVAGATSYTYTFTPGSGDNAKLYRAIFSNICGSDTTLISKLNVGKGVNIPGGNQPKNVAVCGQTVTITGKVTGGAGLVGTLTAVWQYSTDNGITWTTIPGTETTSPSGNFDMILNFPIYTYPVGTLFRFEASNNGCKNLF
jgi:hypothetical protein